MGSYHSSRDLYKSNCDSGNQLFTIKEAIDFLRARTLEKGKSFSINNNDLEYELHINLNKIS